MAASTTLSLASIQHFLKNRRQLVAAIAVALLAFVLILLVLIPQVQELIQLTTDLGGHKQSLDQVNKKLATIDDFTTGPVQQQRGQVDKLLPSEKPLLQLLASLNSTAQATGVILADVNTSPGKLATASASITQEGTIAAPLPPTVGVQDSLGNNIFTVDLEIRGTLDQINSFIDLLERSAPVSNVTAIDLTTNAAEPNQFNAKLRLASYYFTQSVRVGVDLPLPELGAKEQQFLNRLDQFIYPQYQTQDLIQGGGSEDLFGLGQTGQPVSSPAPVSSPSATTP